MADADWLLTIAAAIKTWVPPPEHPKNSAILVMKPGRQKPASHRQGNPLKDVTDHSKHIAVRENPQQGKFTHHTLQIQWHGNRTIAG